MINTYTCNEISMEMMLIFLIISIYPEVEIKQPHTHTKFKVAV